ncbi:MAG: apolipoprotein N-acyltransferase [Puniceicoccales bacterium]|jgi:apolipoprotein N-acyltransferase|nr:apolipoprotein N-acyltransferase [Puniceicoccales bacterium]
MPFFGNSYRVLRALPWLVGVLSSLLLVASMPGFNIAEAAWLWALPFILWAASKPSWKQWLVTVFCSIWLARIITLLWLRHVYPPLGWLGLFLLTWAVAMLPVLWFALLRWLFPRTVGAPPILCIVIQLGLAGAWVSLEWVQSWLLTGFPWCLLAETQWQRPVALALCAWGGPWALGFAIMLFNIGLARYILRFVEEFERTKAERLKAARILSGATPAASPLQALPFPSPLGVMRRICPEFYVGLAPILFAFVSFLFAVRHLNERADRLFTLGVVQTDFDPNAKWDRNLYKNNLAVVRDLTLAAAQLTKTAPVFEFPESGVALPVVENVAGTPELILWPEAAMPARMSDAQYADFLTTLATKTGKTLLIGGIGGDDNGYSNGIFTVTNSGVSEDFYAKRHLVPFGEYVPLASVLPLRKVVPVASDCLPGTRNEPLLVPVPVDDCSSVILKAGALVCYEDVFPELSRDMALRGADFIAVVTNDAWYGREAGAYQHAAHSAVLAASLRLPVVRCGNNGWSGVFNPLGQGEALKDSTGSIYFRGAGRFDVVGIRAPLREPTFYTTHGDWLVLCSGLFTLWACLRNRRWKRAAPGGEGQTCVQ